MSYYVYIIVCMDGSFYTGYTKNIDARIRLHESGKGARYTKMHKPLKVAYFELFNSRAQAMKREKEVKTMTHQQKLKLIKSRNSKNDRPVQNPATHNGRCAGRKSQETA
jgi:predicted GIY-YIG superfamily endonuclease